MSDLFVWLCESCGRRSFPRRELCPFCGGRVFAAERVDRGLATEVTSHCGTDIACVQVDDDVVLLARAGSGVVVGTDVMLHDDRGAPVAVPTT